MDAMGKDVVIVETVGVGQGELDIAQLAHTVVLVLVPGYGDALQAMKAGIDALADALRDHDDFLGHDDRRAARVRERRHGQFARRVGDRVREQLVTELEGHRIDDGVDPYTAAEQYVDTNFERRDG